MMSGTAGFIFGRDAKADDARLAVDARRRPRRRHLHGFDEEAPRDAAAGDAATPTAFADPADVEAGGAPVDDDDVQVIVPGVAVVEEAPSESEETYPRKILDWLI